VQHEASEDLTHEAAPRPNPIINQADNRTAKGPHGPTSDTDRRGSAEPDQLRRVWRSLVTAPRPGDTFRIDLEGRVIAGHYVEVDSPHHMVIDWDREETSDAAPTRIEITFTPMGDGTAMTVEFEGLDADDAAFYGRLWRRYLDRLTPNIHR